MHCAWHFILSGYFATRIYYGNNTDPIQFRQKVLVLVVWSFSFLKLFGLNSLGGRTQGMLGETLYTLRRLNPQNELIERKVFTTQDINLTYMI